MVGERIQARRPFTSPLLEMQISENPIPTSGPEPKEPVFPRDLLSTSDLEEAVLDSTKQVFADVENVDVESDIKVDKDITRRRGLGEFTDVTILVNVEGARPGEVSQAVEEMASMGFVFSSVEFR